MDVNPNAPVSGNVPQYESYLENWDSNWKKTLQDTPINANTTIDIAFASYNFGANGMLGGYDSFDAFLTALASRKRKAIRREREDAMANGVSVHWLTGSELTESVWDAFFEFYMETGSRKWGRPYLTRNFYTLMGERMADKIVLIMAKRAGRFVAGAINFIGSDTLFGRHWGANEHHPFLHFELCYYQAIDFAIAHGLKRVEAGAQGEHKLARGYLPVTTHSAHFIADQGLRRAVADYLARERAYVESAGAELAAMAPFRKDLEHDAGI
jgi:hypothetical protein